VSARPGRSQRQTWMPQFESVQQSTACPLGIELAVGWLSTLTLSEIADEVYASLETLSDEGPGLAERNRSLVAVFDTSWKLLTHAERNVRLLLGVFRHGFDRSAAGIVA